MEIHQFAPALLAGDAIGNQIRLLRRIIQAAGFHSKIYAAVIDPLCASEAHDYKEYIGDSQNIGIYHHAIGTEIADYVCALPDRIVPYYHNITVPETFLGFNKPLQQAFKLGRQQLAQLSRASYALAASEYNREEMLAVGYRDVDVLTYGIEMTEEANSGSQQTANKIKQTLLDGKTNWLFVGRIAPNKRQDNVIRAFHYYHTQVNASSRLIFVGSSATSPAYGLALDLLVNRLGIARAVEFVGQVSDKAALSAYYASADVFVCLSEHEGFCVPLLESMHFNVPIVALNRTAVPYTLGNSGILIDDYRFDVIAEVIDLLRLNTMFREKIIAEQQRQMHSFAIDRVRPIMQVILKRMTTLESII